MSVSSGQKLLCLGTAQQVGGAVSELVARVLGLEDDAELLDAVLGVVLLGRVGTRRRESS